MVKPDDLFSQVGIYLHGKIRSTRFGDCRMRGVTPALGECIGRHGVTANWPISFRQNFVAQSNRSETRGAHGFEVKKIMEKLFAAATAMR